MMINRVYFLKAQQKNETGGTCHAYRTMAYKGFFAPKLNDVVSEFFNEITEANGLHFDGWLLESFSKVK